MVLGNFWPSILVVYIVATAGSNFMLCEARKSLGTSRLRDFRIPDNSVSQPVKKLRTLCESDIGAPFNSPSPYATMPHFSLPPLDSIAPVPSPHDRIPTPSYCLLPPPPSGPAVMPSPPKYYPSPNVPAIMPSPPKYNPSPSVPTVMPSPPEPSPPKYYPSPSVPTVMPSPPKYNPSPSVPIVMPSPPEPSPPKYYPSPSVPTIMPSPPKYNPSSSVPTIIPSPPKYNPRPSSPGSCEPSPPKLIPGPPLHSPPVVHSPTPPKGQVYTIWCVAKPTVPDSIIQAAMDYACGAGADCKPVQPNGPCYQPDNLLSHASFAFNSYWQKKKEAGGTCDFGGTAMLVTVDPSFKGCHFDFS